MEQEHKNKKRGHWSAVRLAAYTALVALLAGSITYLLSNHEPQYEDRALSEWLHELDGGIANSENRLAAEEAIRQMGAKSLPYLIRLLKTRPSRVSLRSRLTDWLEEHSEIPIQLPAEHDRSGQVVAAFMILGVAGKPAINELAGMVGVEAISQESAQCLAAIGPASIPALTNALASKKHVVRAAGMLGLAEMGTAAKETTPLLAVCMHDTNRSIVGDAIRALGEMGEAGEHYAPEFEKMLADTNYTDAAAFALARLGPRHVGALLDALTNKEERVIASAMTGLEPRFRVVGPRGRTDLPVYSFRWAFFFFEETKMRNESRILVPRISRAHRQIVLLANFDNPDAKVRSRIANLLSEDGPMGYPAIPALTKALGDGEEEVRRSATEALGKIDVEVSEGGIIRGPKKEKKIALEFTGHIFAEGGETILNELAKHHAKASFFLTGDFLDNPEFKPLIERIIGEGHYLGPHSDKHLLYCPWSGPKKTLVTREAFNGDLFSNSRKIRRLKVRPSYLYWLPAYEWYNQEIADWSKARGFTLVNYTPGTRSNADYTEEASTNFVSSKVIYDSIIKKEQEDPHGLNGFLLLMHIGVGPGRADKMHGHLGELLDYLSGKGYQFVRVDELLTPK